MLKLKRSILLLPAILLLTPWLASYAYGVGDDTPIHETVRVEAAEPSTSPSATFFGKAIGGITPGDLFYIDAPDNSHDITVTLYLTNAHELTHYLRYLILKVGIYSESSDGSWQMASSWNGKLLPDTYITLRNSPVSLTLAGYAKYKVTIDAGSFYCTAANSGENAALPQFYLTVESV